MVVSGRGFTVALNRVWMFADTRRLILVVGVGRGEHKRCFIPPHTRLELHDEPTRIDDGS